jgi:hypothetical protein
MFFYFLLRIFAFLSLNSSSIMIPLSSNSFQASNDLKSTLVHSHLQISINTTFQTKTMIIMIEPINEKYRTKKV